MPEQRNPYNPFKQHLEETDLDITTPEELEEAKIMAGVVSPEVHRQRLEKHGGHGKGSVLEKVRSREKFIDDEVKLIKEFTELFAPALEYLGRVGDQEPEEYPSKFKELLKPFQTRDAEVNQLAENITADLMLGGPNPMISGKEASKENTKLAFLLNEIFDAIPEMMKPPYLMKARIEDLLNIFDKYKKELEKRRF